MAQLVWINSDTSPFISLEIVPTYTQNGHSRWEQLHEREGYRNGEDIKISNKPHSLRHSRFRTAEQKPIVSIEFQTQRLLIG